MKIFERYSKRLPFIALLLSAFVSGCWHESNNGSRDAVAPTATSTTPTNITIPTNSGTGVPINSKLTATFSEAMNPATITTQTFMVTGPGTTPVAGKVTYSGVDHIATFKPTGHLASNTAYTGTITTGAEDKAGNALPANKTWSFETGTAADTTAPTVTSTVPVNATTGVAINGNITAGFDEVMDPATITKDTFTLMQGTTPVLGTVTYAGTTATFNPSNDLAANTTFTATITAGHAGDDDDENDEDGDGEENEEGEDSDGDEENEDGKGAGAKDLVGNALVSNYVWTFTTGTTQDTSVPTANSTIPTDGATGVVLNGNITASFDEAMDPATINTNTFTVMQGTIPVPGVVTYAGTTATFNPSTDLAPGTSYTVTMTTGMKDVLGNALANPVVWNFTTGATPDTTAPTAISKIPADGATGVVMNGDLTASFDEAMDPATINTNTFTVMQGTIPVPGVVSYAGTTATFNPSTDLAPGTSYTVTMTTGMKDVLGNALASAVVWSFTTGAMPTAGPAPVVLGTAGNYVILAKSAISTTGTTAIVGDIGLSPAAASFVTGFALTAPPSTYTTSALVTGKIYASDYDPPTPSNLTTAVLDMQTAYTDAAGRTLPDFTELGAGNISGLTLVPGLYKWGTGVLAASGVTLSGGANDVWIFQIGQDLTVNNGVIITLSGGAQAKNIFWQVAGQATLGTTSDFKGIILSQTQIVLATGAVMNGRALAQTAVTLDANAVTQPAP